VTKRVFHESDVNRDGQGQFAEKPGGGGGGNASFLAKFSKKIGATDDAATAKAKLAEAAKTWSPSAPKKTGAFAGIKVAKKAAPTEPPVTKAESPKNTAVKVAGPATLPKKKGAAKVKLTPGEPQVVNGIHFKANGEVDWKQHGIDASSSTGKPLHQIPDTLAKKITKAQAMLSGKKIEKHNFGKFKPVTRTRAAALHKQMQEGSPWTENQRLAVIDYTGEGYKDINAELRKPGSAPWTQDVARDLRRSMREIPEDIVVYRSVGGRQFGAPRSGEEIPDDKLGGLVGRVWSDPGFTSTSVVEGEFDPENRTKMVISVPKGTRGAYAESVT
jgi:hypothetical protein